MQIFLLGSVMKKDDFTIRTVIGSVMLAFGFVMPASAQDDVPEVERVVVELKPLHFEVGGVAVTDSAENQNLWTELMKYKLWGTDQVIFNKHGFRISETSGFTGTAQGDVIFNDYGHTLGGPIVSGRDLVFAKGDAKKDSLIGGSIYARNLYLSDWYKVEDSRYDGNICFEGTINFGMPNRNSQFSDYVWTLNRFIENAHKENDSKLKKGMVYADWNADFSDPKAVNLDGPYSQCPEDVPKPEKNLSVPLLDETGITWEPAVDLNSSYYGEVQYIHVPPVTVEDVKNEHTWFDKFVDNIHFEGNYGKKLYILMPSRSQNADGKTGRLTRIFTKKGVNISGSANDTKIQVAYVDNTAKWNGSSWEKADGSAIDVSAITVVPDSNYAGNLLFYTNADIYWSAMNANKESDYQGTYITTGDFTINDHISVAGQLIAGGTLWFESEFSGEFHYVPFNSPEINTDVFAKGLFKESAEWHPMDFYLTDTAHTDVSFDYCFAFFGSDIDTTGGKYDGYRQNEKGTFATPEDLDLADKTHPMPLCLNDEVGHITIKKGNRKPYVPSYIKVKLDETREGDEFMVFKITNLNGAVLSGNKFDGGLVVQLVDVNNNPPVFVDLDKVKLSVPENATKAVAGQIKVEDSDGDDFIYSIEGGDSDLFEIDPSTGIVSMKAGVKAFDYEEWKVTGKTYSIVVEACEISTYMMLCTDDYTFKISITDVNEMPYFTYTDVSEQVVKIAENEMFSGDSVKFADTDKFNTDGLLTDNEVIAIGGDTAVFDVSKAGVLYTKKGVVLDYETKSTYKVTLRVRDATKDADGNLVYPDLYDDMEFTVLVTDVKDGPEFDAKVYNGSIVENSVAPTEVDMDSPIYATTSQIGATITYSLLDETKSFVINPNTGAISVAESAVLDYETKSVYTMKVVASDASGIANQIVQTDTADVVINLIDVNENPIFVEPTKTLQFPENQKGWEIGTLSFDDLDTAAKFRNNKFELVEEVDGFDLDEDGVLTTTRKFDYETEPTTYNLTVRIFDASNANLSVTGVVKVELLNTNEPPYLKELVLTVPESDTVGSVFNQPLEPTDLDDPNNIGTYKFFILDGGKEEGATREFKLDSATGKFTVAAPLDFEKTESYSIRVRVKDSEGCEKFGCSDTTITIKVIDVNEAPSILVDTIYVYEDQPLNDPFSSVKTDDDDPDFKNDKFRNNVYENTDSDIFKVLPDGDVVLVKTVDYESDSLYTITVRVTDKDNGELTSTKKVVVKVHDVYEKSEVEITRVETDKEVYLNTNDTIFVNQDVVGVEWKENEKVRTSRDSLKLGCNEVIKTFHDKTQNDPGADTVIICYSTATPIVTVSTKNNSVTAEDIYTVVEKTSDSDTAVYVNKIKNDIFVTVKDSAANVSNSFTVNVKLETVSVPSDDFKDITKIAETKVSRKKDPASGITSVPENGNYVKNSYTETVNGTNVTISYYTDNKGKDVKHSVITSSGKKKDIAVIEVSYTVKIDGKDVTISYFADASTGERVSLDTGVSDSESVLSAEGDAVVGSYKVSYSYVDEDDNVVEISYYLDEKGKIAKNSEGNIGYNVSYTYVNKFGNSSKKELLIVLDQKGPVVKIESPSEDEVLTANFVEVSWTVNGAIQDTLKVQGLENGVNTIVREFRDKAGNKSRDSVHVMVKKVKNIDIDVEKPVTLVNRDSVDKFYKSKAPKKDQTFGVTFYNHKKHSESEAVVGIKDKSQEGSGEEPYPGFDGHLGPTLTVDARVPVANALGGLATLDDIMSAGGMIALDGVDAANSRKVSVSEYVEQYCTDEFKQSMTSDYSKMNLYWTTLKVKVWVYTNTGVFTDYFSFDYDLNNPEYVNEAGLLKFFVELKPDENGDVRTSEGRLYGTGAYFFKTEVKMNSKLRCDLPTSPEDENKDSKKKNAVIKSSDELLKSFGYRRPVDN